MTTTETAAGTVTRTFRSPGITWDWYIQGTFNETDRTVTLLFYDRWHGFEHAQHPQAERRPEARLVENETRQVVAVTVDDVRYTVVNPRHVFDYRDFSQLTLAVNPDAEADATGGAR